MTNPSASADRAQRDYERTARKLRNKTAADSKRQAASLKRATSKIKKALRASRNAGRSNKVWSLLSKAHRGGELADAYASKKGEIISTNMLLSSSPKERAAEWDLECKKHPRVRKDRVVMHLTLSRPNGADLTSQKWGAVVQCFLREAGLEGAAYVAYLHTDTKCQHVHIVVSRSLPTGKLWSDSQDFYKFRDASERAVQVLNIEVEGTPSTSQAPTDRAVSAVRRANRRGTPSAWVDPQVVERALSRAKRLEELPALLQAEGVEFKLAQKSPNDKVTGVLMRAKGSQEWLAGSSINRNFSLPALERQLASNASKDAPIPRPPIPGHMHVQAAQNPSAQFPRQR
nr:relaxase/mobilization nuclease domain-containing protein [uncultured Rhodoferax sp.]